MSLELIVNTTWTNSTFNGALEFIKMDKPEKDMKFWAYGAFHEWKASETNFHEMATKLFGLDDSKAYKDLVMDVYAEWVNFVCLNDLKDHQGLGKRWQEREYSKVENFINKRKAVAA